MINIVLFGPPGAGKGTQSELLIKKYGFIHISTGDIFRGNIKNSTDLGILAKSFMDKGNLVPDEVTINMLKDAIQKNPSVKGYLFDGFPRTTAQAEALDSLLKTIGFEINKMVALNVEDDELRERLRKRAEVSGRVDDANPNVINKRIEVYKNETMPVAQFYKAQNKYEEINGIGEIEVIFENLCNAIDK